MAPRTNQNLEVVGEMKLDDFFQIKILSPDKTNTINGMTIKIRYTKHYIPCFGFKLFYKGRSLGYSSDTIFDQEHIDFLSECDLILHETNKAGHTDYNKLCALPPGIRKKIFLLHIYDEFPVQNSEIPVVRQGQLYYV